MIDFAILQLRFLADLSQSKGRENELALIPESLVKLPSQYIAQVATSFQQYLSPKQAENAVKYAIILLGSVKKLSVQVQMELVRISGAFIRASVQREESKQRRKINMLVAMITMWQLTGESSTFSVAWTRMIMAW